jgi:hypothetical protein
MEAEAGENEVGATVGAEEATKAVPRATVAMVAVGGVTVVAAVVKTRVVAVWAEAGTVLVDLGMVVAVVRARGTARVARVAEVAMAVAERVVVATVGTVVVSVAQGIQVDVVRAAAARAAVARVVVARVVHVVGAG